MSELVKVYDAYYVRARENLDQYECIEALPEPILEELTQEAGDTDLSVELVKEWLLETLRISVELVMMPSTRWHSALRK